MIDRNTWGAALAFLFLFGGSTVAAQEKVAAVGERLISMPPCRLIDTRVAAAKDAREESVRRVNVATDRCGRIVPTVASAYAIRVNVHDRTVGNVPPAARAAGPVRRFPAGAAIDFPVGAADHIAVDLEGYYVPEGVVTDPGPSSTSGVATEPDVAVSDPGTVDALRPSVPRSEANPTGPAGDIYLDGSIYPVTGVLAVANAQKPWTVMKSGDSGGWGGFAVFNSNDGELLRLASNGPLRLTTNTYFSGRSDYREVASPLDNVFTQVRIVNPRDFAGGSTNRVTFFNARSDDEVGSPPTTKFQAFTLGYYNQKDINFDSQVRYHWPGYEKIHYRAHSTGDGPQGKDTFWVKAATDFDSLNGTRADMYVSGLVGVGTPAPRSLLHVVRNASGALGPELILENNANSVGDAEALTFSANNSARAQIRSTVGANPWYGTLEFRTGIITPVERMRITGAGDVGIGTPAPSAKLHVVGNTTFVGNMNVSGAITGATVIGATYQDLAEWVPSSTDMAPGTVVVLNTAATNEVMPSVKPYDTAVAGVVSAQPGVLLGVPGAAKEMIATTGRVRVKVDATAAPILVGDLLVSSDKPGMAMKSRPVDIAGFPFHRPGTLIGKALEPLASGEGEILVLLSLQ